MQCTLAWQTSGRLESLPHFCSAAASQGNRSTKRRVDKFDFFENLIF